MNITTLASLLLCLSLLPGCASTHPPIYVSTPPEATSASTPEAAQWQACRIIAGAEEGSLILSGTDRGEVFTLGTAGLEVLLDGQAATAAELQNGMAVEVGFDGNILETYPAQFSHPTALKAQSADRNGRYDLYLQVLADLWEVDPALNQNITELGVDFSGLTDLTGGEQSALAYAFGMEHGLMPLTSTWQELVDEGYIDGEHLYWEDGCHFSITGDASSFEAQKWASGRGAYCFSDCTGTESGGVWTYEVGAQLIS